MSSQSDELAESAAEVPDPADPAVEGDPYDDLDLDFAPASRAGLGKLTTGLLIAVALVAAFGAGSYVQKHHGSTTRTTASRGFAAGGARAGGFGGAEGGFAGFGAGAGAGAAGAAGSAGVGGAASGGTSSAATPAVIGTVVKVDGHTLTVKNFAGKTIKVTVPSGVTVTKSSTVDLSKLATGSSVTVTGTTSASGDVTATGVTAR